MSNKRMGGSSVDANVLGVRFFDDTYQNTACIHQCGLAVCTGTSVSVTFPNAYIGQNAPTVVASGVDGFYSHGLFFGISSIGSSGAWTGFTITLSGTFFGAFNWIAIGNPN